MSNFLRSGEGKDLSLTPGQSIAISTITGTVTADVIAGTAKGTNLLSASTSGGTFGPYASGAVIRVTAGEGAQVDYDIGTNPANSFDQVAKLAFSADGSVSGLIDPMSGARYALGETAQFSETTMQPFSAALNTGTANFTFALQVPCPSGEFFAVQLIYQNSGSSALTLDASSVCAVATDLATGSGLTQTSVTFNGATSVVIPACTGTGANIIPGRVVSDVVFVKSIARSDAGPYPLLQIRSFYVAAATVMAVTSGATGSFFQYQQLTGYEYAGGFSGGNAGTGAITMSRSNNIITPASVIFYAGSCLHAIPAVGDSLCTGQGSSGGFLNAQTRAALLSGGKFTARNLGIAGQIHNASYQTGLAAIAEGKAKALIFWAMSPNDSQTQANFDKSWGETLALVQRCRLSGVTPILCTSGPVNAWTAPQDALIKAQNARVRALCATGVAILSDNARVIDPTDSGQIFAAYNSGDGLHYSDAGYQAIAVNALYPAIKAAGLA